MVESSKNQPTPQPTRAFKVDEDNQWWNEDRPPGETPKIIVGVDPRILEIAEMAAEVLVKSAESSRGHDTSEWSLAKGVDSFLSIVAVLAPILEIIIYTISMYFGDAQIPHGWSIVIVAISALAKSVNSNSYTKQRTEAKSNAANAGHAAALTILDIQKELRSSLPDLTVKAVRGALDKPRNT